MNMHRILLIDNIEASKRNGDFLKQKGFEVILQEDPNKAIAYLKGKKVDGIVLETIMHGYEMDGFETLKKIRELTDIPVLFLTERTEEEYRLKGLMMGADDYLTKPCCLEELYLRLMINIRKAQKMKERDSILSYPPLMIDFMNHKVTCHNQEIKLSNREYELLVLLVSNPGKEMTFEEIGASLYECSVKEDRKNIMVNASRLRKKLGAFEDMENRIETVWGKGYRFT